jgi:predicted Zn-dependent protease with MMP-like domain/curved DNA-binding protein CbpA
VSAVAGHTSRVHSSGAAGTGDLDLDDYYAVLGVGEDASSEEIRQAFRTLAKRWHPDHFATASPEERGYAERRMKAVLEAHAVLGDPVRRHEYERLRHEAVPWSPGPQPHKPHFHAAARRGSYSVYTDADRRAGNPNGAGQALGVLCVMLALALFASMLVHGPAQGVMGTIQVGLFLAFVVLALILFQDDSFLARAANAYMEAEPRGTPQAHNAVQHHAPHGHYAPVGTHTDSPSPAEGQQEPAELDFERWVDEALESVPAEFQAQMDNVVVRVEDEPSEDDLRSTHVPPGHTLLGLYHGVPLTRQGARGHGPEVISIYRLPIERYCHHEPEAVRAQVRATVLHELAHHFGIDHDDMPEWVK